jgi:hypothetical protein
MLDEFTAKVLRLADPFIVGPPVSRQEIKSRPASMRHAA